jgi:Kef-type K+ transport system membrane component KefB
VAARAADSQNDLSMNDSAQFLLTIGCLLLLGLATSAIARHTFLPRVTLLLLLGILIGEYGLDLIPNWLLSHFDLIANMTLLMVGFLLGGKLTHKVLKNSVSEVVWISLVAAISTAVLVFLGLILWQVPWPIALILGCIASATAPAAIMDVIGESGLDNSFSQKLVSIVALDDIWALIIFGVGLALVSSVNGSQMSFLQHVSVELGGAVLLGVILGIPAARLTGRIHKGRPILTEALALVFVCGGLAMALNVSYLITAMVMGAVVANWAKHHEYPFHAIEGVEAPLLMIFFVLAGASLDLSGVTTMGIIAVIYLLGRIIGKVFGAALGGYCAGSSPLVKRWMGIALLPQAGVPVGMALVASTQFPQYQQLLLSVVVATTVIFDLVGPIFTRVSLDKSTLRDR